jgi:hypothetical protein
MNRRTGISRAVAIIAAAAVAAGAAYLLRGDRWRLYTDARAAHCWNAVESLALPSSSLRPVGVTVEAGSVRIEYLMDRVLAGAVLDVQCRYGEGESHAQSIALNGMPLDAETLRSLNE